MPSFTKKIRTPNGGVYTFDFTRMYTIEGTQYFVFACDRQNHSCHFPMRQKEGLWVIMDMKNVPDWVVPLEVELANTILAH